MTTHATFGEYLRSHATDLFLNGYGEVATGIEIATDPTYWDTDPFFLTACVEMNGCLVANVPFEQFDELGEWQVLVMLSDATEPTRQAAHSLLHETLALIEARRNAGEEYSTQFVDER